MPEFHARFLVWTNLSHGPNVYVCRRFPSRMDVVECVSWLVLESRQFVRFCAVSFDQNSFFTHVEWFLDKQVSHSRLSIWASDLGVFHGQHCLRCLFEVSNLWARSNRGEMIFKHCAKCVQPTKYVCGFLMSASSARACCHLKRAKSECKQVVMNTNQDKCSRMEMRFVHLCAQLWSLSPDHGENC